MCKFKRNHWSCSCLFITPHLNVVLINMIYRVLIVTYHLLKVNIQNRKKPCKISRFDRVHSTCDEDEDDGYYQGDDVDVDGRDLKTVRDNVAHDNRFLCVCVLTYFHFHYLDRHIHSLLHVLKY